MSRQNWGETPVPDRVAFRAATRFVAVGDCHESTYSVASHGYAQIGWQDADGKRHGTTAHRAAWAHHHGQVAQGETVDRTCKNRRCVRIEHLRSLPNLENARRTAGRDWPVGTCANGHGPELWRPKGPTRKKGYCHACRMNIQRRRRAAAKL